MKKYAITGHTNGIGKHLFDHLKPNVIGFSKTNGFDILNAKSREKIILQSTDCDVFINNASDSIGSTYLLIEWFIANRNFDKKIINVGSQIANVDGAVKREDLLKYQADKLILKEMSLRLMKEDKKCSIIYKSLPYVGTEKILKKYPTFTENDYITLDDALNIILL